MKKYKPRGKLKAGAYLWNTKYHSICIFIKYNRPYNALVNDIFGNEYEIAKCYYRFATKEEIADAISQKLQWTGVGSDFVGSDWHFQK